MENIRMCNNAFHKIGLRVFSLIMLVAIASITFSGCKKKQTRTRAGLNKLIAEETGKDEAQVAKDTDRDYWLNAEEAEEYGLVGKIIKSRDDLK